MPEETSRPGHSSRTRLRAPTHEHRRLAEARDGRIPWRKWGPYLSERQWGTVREDYSESGDAWDYFTHEQSRSRAYRWGEDGLAGLSDDKQRLCFALALWNGHDPILKERLFGLTNSEGNHGEDVKECYFYLDATPTHSYMKYLYKYPQRAFPYEDLVRTNHARSRAETEYELVDTGIFADDRYFDVVVEYAKDGPADIAIRLSVFNRGPDPATLHVLPTLWFRNMWSPEAEGSSKPQIMLAEGFGDMRAVRASHAELGDYFLYLEGQPPMLVTENETNNERIFGTANLSPYVKDGIDRYVVHGERDAVNSACIGTKAAAHYILEVGGRRGSTIRLRLTDRSPADFARDASLAEDGEFITESDAIVDIRHREADEFYAAITPDVSGDEAAVMRQALSGLLWSKQYYSFDAGRWLRDHDVRSLTSWSRNVRNRDWFHMINEDVISMPDKWEYPWYAAWDLAFHAVALSVVDIDFAKQQMQLMLEAAYLHPNGQMPAYEWNFSDVNPPVHAWATLFLYQMERVERGITDVDFLKRAFNKLILNFAWWANRKDVDGHNVFEGGFLGLDNIGVFDRSAPLPTGGHLVQADGTGWMALFAQNMAEIAVELSVHDPAYEELAVKFVEHFFWIASAINDVGNGGLWDEQDGFYYDVLRLPDGTSQRLRVRSIVGLLPMCATTVVEKQHRERAPRAVEQLAFRLRQTPELMSTMHPMGSGHLGVADRGLLALVNQDRLRRILATMLDEEEFLSPYGIRSLSRYHLEHPYVFNVHGDEFRVDYVPAESNSGMFGGNSNWRGPVWLPINALIIRALLQFYLYYGDTLKVECPTGSKRMLNLFEVSREIASRLTRAFLRDKRGRRPVYGGCELFQTDPHWRDHILFHEYLHGDNGAGLGASHQTGWTALVGSLIHIFGHLDAQAFLRGGKASLERLAVAPPTAA